MSLWRWIPISSCKAECRIKLAFCSILALFACASAWVASAGADTEPTSSSGPVSAEEGALLWKDGSAAFERGADAEAIPMLERFVARYPGYPGYVDAKRMLGRAYLRTQAPEKARAPLKAFILARGKTLEALQARLELARADLELKRFSEAVLTADEAIRISSAPAFADRKELKAEALALRAIAQLELGQGKRSEASARTAIAAVSESAVGHRPQILGEAKNVLLTLKLKQCARFPSSGKLAEAQVRDQLARRGICLHDALLTFREVLQTEHPLSLDRAVTQTTKAFASYWEKCRNPPAPPPIRPKDRSAQQLKTYFRELSVVLEEDCRQKIRQGRELLAGWDASTAANASSPLKRAISGLEPLK
jgi:tetratricopeptide (TPR) repeat protein